MMTGFDTPLLPSKKIFPPPPKEVEYQYKRGELLARYVAYGYFNHAWIKYKPASWQQSQAEITFNIPEYKSETYQSTLVKTPVKGLVYRILTLQDQNDETDSPVTIIVLFQGTACKDGIKRDLEKKSPGEEGFKKARVQIHLALTEAIKPFLQSQREITLEICGHSLGGADAQRCVVSVLNEIHKPDRTQWSLITVVTLIAFNSPAATRNNATQIASLMSASTKRIKLNAYYYFSKWDIVHQAGQQHLLLPTQNSKEIIKENTTVHVIYATHIDGMLSDSAQLSTLKNCKIAHCTSGFIPDEKGKKKDIRYEYLSHTVTNWEEEYLERIKVGLPTSINWGLNTLFIFLVKPTNNFDHENLHNQEIYKRLNQQLTAKLKVIKEKKRDDLIEIIIENHDPTTHPSRIQKKEEKEEKEEKNTNLEFHEISLVDTECKFSLLDYQASTDKNDHLKSLFRNEVIDSTNLAIIKTMAQEAVRLSDSIEKCHQQGGQAKADAIGKYINTLLTSRMNNTNLLFNKLLEILEPNSDSFPADLKLLLTSRNHVTRNLAMCTGYQPKSKTMQTLETAIYISLIKKYNALSEKERKHAITVYFPILNSESDYQKINILLCQAHRLLTTPAQFLQWTGTEKAVAIARLLHTAKNNTILNTTDPQNPLRQALQKPRNYFNPYGLFSKFWKESTTAYEAVAALDAKPTSSSSP